MCGGGPEAFWGGMHPALPRSDLHGAGSSGGSVPLALFNTLKWLRYSWLLPQPRSLHDWLDWHNQERHRNGGNWERPPGAVSDAGKPQVFGGGHMATLSLAICLHGAPISARL